MPKFATENNYELVEDYLDFFAIQSTGELLDEQSDDA